MFVPKAGGRSTRRRPRTSSDDSVNPPKAKRQRSVLRRPDESPSDTNLGREIAKLTTPTQPNGETLTDPTTDSHLASRAPKQGDKLGNSEGTVVLVSGQDTCVPLRRPLKPWVLMRRESIVKYRFLHGGPVTGIARSNSRFAIRYVLLIQKLTLRSWRVNISKHRTPPVFLRVRS